MKKFTVKDFLLYACPCYGCSSPVSVYVGLSYIDSGGADGSILPTITQGNIRVDLKFSYTGTLSIAIDLKTNKLATNSLVLLKEYLSKHKVYLLSVCTKCNTRFETKHMDFNLDKGFVLPVEMQSEFFVLNTRDNVFHYLNIFDEKTCHVNAIRLDKTPLSATKLSLPLLPAYKFKDRNLLIKKIRTYLLFS